MVDASAVAVVLSALGVGGLAGALLRAEYERTERLREQMMLTADAFLEHAEDASRLIDRAQLELRAGNSQIAQLTLAEAYASIADARTVLPRIAIWYRDPLVAADGWELAERLRRELALVDEHRLAIDAGGDVEAVTRALTVAQTDAEARRLTMIDRMRAALRRRWRL